MAAVHPTSALIPFQFKTHAIKVHLDDAGDPWWDATEIAAALEHTNLSMLIKRLDDDEKTLNSIYPDGQPSWWVNESGLYNLILGSRKKEAKDFKRWVTREVLPQIRKTGQYTPSHIPQVRDPAIQMLIDMAVHLDEARAVASEAKQLATVADAKADMAIASQQWLTVRKYVFLHDLERQMPPSACKAYGTFLTGYCFENGIPVDDQPVADRQWGKENSYYAGAIAKTLPGWLSRQHGQEPLVMVARGKD